jgi:hypothetical protein
MTTYSALRFLIRELTWTAQMLNYITCQCLAVSGMVAASYFALCWQCRRSNRLELQLLHP